MSPSQSYHFTYHTALPTLEMLQDVNSRDQNLLWRRVVGWLVGGVEKKFQRKYITTSVAT